MVVVIAVFAARVVVKEFSFCCRYYFALCWPCSFFVLFVLVVIKRRRVVFVVTSGFHGGGVVLYCW